ncbi:MAG: hypothetical protein KDE08_16465 [Rhodobacteraceae bacterium]|nr:hypothetical protein [Paracoccaceae bacterium]
MTKNAAQEVRRRLVFYVPGYDPFHPRRYRELYRKEGADQAAIGGYRLSLHRGENNGAHGWVVTAEIGGEAVTTDFEVLVWSDIVRRSMSDGIVATYLQLIRTAWIYIRSGAIFRLVRLRKGPAIAALYPIAMLLAQLGLAVAAGLVVRSVLDRLLARAVVEPAISSWLAGVAGIGVAAALLSWFRARDKWFYAYYLMHDYAFTAQNWGANPPVLEERIRQFRDRIEAALEGGWDEVLVVGHSSGAHLAISVLADLIRRAEPGRVDRVGFLSLGHVVPMASFLPAARRLRGDLALLSAQDDITWIDVTAPGDGCAYALCDPVAVTGVATEESRWPLVISAAFTQTLSPARWRELRWRFFRLHFQYLCAFDRPGDYDYFQITAGPSSLRTRFRDRQPSKSRIVTALNRYRDVA